MNYDDVVSARSAINFFDPDRDVSEAELNKVIILAARVSSGFNLQPWNLIVLREQKEKARLQEFAWNQPKATETPVVLIVLADRSGWQEDNPVLEKNWSEVCL